MKRINKLLFELLQDKLKPSYLEGINHHVPDEHIMKVQQQLLEEVDGVNVNQTGCCIIIRRDRIGNLYATNTSGNVEDVVGRRIVIDTHDADQVSESDALVLILLSMVYSGYGRHLYLDDKSIMEWRKDGICPYEYKSYPCLAELSQDIDLSLMLSEIADIEGEDHRDRIPAYIETIFKIREIVPDYNAKRNSRPIFVEMENGKVYIYGKPDEDTLADFIVRPIDVFNDGENLRGERIAVLLIHEWSVKGAGLDKSGSYASCSNHLAHTAEILHTDLQHKISKGLLPVPEELEQIRKYQSLGMAYNICRKYLRSQCHFKHLLDQADRVHTYRLESPEEIPGDERLDFFDRAISYMRLGDRKPGYNAVMMLIATAPSCPVTNVEKKLAVIFNKHLEHSGIVESSFYHGYFPSNYDEEEENSSARLFIFLMNINNNRQPK